MKKWIRMILTAALVLVFLFSITRLLEQMQGKAAGDNIYEDALSLATSGKTTVEESQHPTEEEADTPVELQWLVAPVEEEDPHIRTLEDINLDALREVNPEVVGWILIPDTQINYPLMQGTDNDYYLKNTWDGKRYAVGSIFLEHLCSPDFTDFNTIIYGHNMDNGSMFAGLREYRNTQYWEQHPYVYVLSDEGIYRYEIFSSYKARTDSAAYGLSFNQAKTRVNFLTEAIGQSGIQTGLVPDLTDRILTLSTCSGAGYSTRWVVHARLKMIQAEATE